MKARLLVVLLASALGGCYSLPGPSADESMASQDSRLKEVVAQIAPPQIDDIKIVRGPYLGSKVVTEDDRKVWLTSKNVTLTPNYKESKRLSIPANELVSMLRDKFGVNITTALPLDGYQYTGLGVKDVDGETALKLLFGSMSLDYEINNKLKYVTIVPLKRRQWTLSIGNRKTSFAAGGAFQESGSGSNGSTGTGNSTGSGQSSSGSGFGSSTLTSATGTNSSSSSGSNNGSNGSNGNNDANGNSVSTSESIWKTLREELAQRVEIMIPKTTAASSLLTPNMAAVPSLQGSGMPPIPMQPVPQIIQASGGAASNGGAKDFYDKVKIATFSLNPDTGAVTVQGPSWVLDDIGTYLDEVEAMYNTVLAFDGKIIVFNTSSDRSEGLDVSSFLKWAGGRYGAVLSNPVLGGVQVSFPTSGSLIPSVTSGGQNISQTALGITSGQDGLNVFNGYLSSLGTVNTVQTPRVVTTSGVPMEFEQLEPESYVKYDQVAAAGGTGSAAVGTNNTEIEVPFGTRMRISPRYDAKTGLVRAQVQIYYSVKVGTQPLKQIVSSSNGTSREVAYDKPKQFLFKQTTEILARDNDLVILSQSVADSGAINNSGITGLGDVSSLFGKRSATNGRKTYFFALRVRVTRRGVGG
jgi:hypothetical protein